MNDIFTYNKIVKSLRAFFSTRLNFIEVPAQSRLSILATCEDPKTISTFNFRNQLYPLPQTGQMWLEQELLTNAKNEAGVFCITTSYRNEENPIAGRHDLIFPMFEFESFGTISDLLHLEADLLDFLGWDLELPYSFVRHIKYYNELCTRYNTSIIEAEHEAMTLKDYGGTVFLVGSPQRSHPFWNIKRYEDGNYAKCDVILNGMETIGSAERSTDPEQMRQNFYTVSDGEYANLLFEKFGEARVERELEQYLALPMVPRFGGGIGLTRLARLLQ